MLKWQKAIVELCDGEGEGSIECEKEWAFRDADTAARALDGYYSKSVEDREAWDAANADTVDTLKASLTAAWISSNTPAAGAAGSACSKTSKCTDKLHCCGTATPNSAATANGAVELTGVCATKSTGSYTNEELGLTYTHVCGAKALIATATTLLAAAYLM